MIRRVTFRQPERMWLSQIELDSDVVAQYEGVEGVGQYNSPTDVAALSALMGNVRIFYRIRAFAALTLGRMRGEAGAMATESLFQFFRSNYFYEGGEGSQMRPNDFTDFAAYHLQKAIPHALSLVRDAEGQTPEDVLAFLLHLLKYNDNTGNAYSDYAYLAAVIETLGQVQPKNEADWQAIVKQVNRFLHLERLLPSYHNRVTVACLKVMKRLQADGKVPLNPGFFTTYAQYGFYRKVRIVALRLLCQLDASLEGDGMRLLMKIIESDPDPFVRYKAAKLLSTLASSSSSSLSSSTTTLSNSTSPSSSTSPPQLANKALARLWNLLNGTPTAWDLRMRTTLLDAYRALGGGSLPTSSLVGSLESSRHRAERRKMSEVDLEQGTFVASIEHGTGKIRLVRSNKSSGDGIPVKQEENSTPVVKRLKLKLGTGESAG